MDDQESTPIENVLEVEQSHSAEAEKALAELNGSDPSSSPPQQSQPAIAT